MSDGTRPLVAEGSQAHHRAALRKHQGPQLHGELRKIYAASERNSNFIVGDFARTCRRSSSRLHTKMLEERKSWMVKKLRMKRFEARRDMVKEKTGGERKKRRRCQSVDSFLQIKAVEGVRSVDSHMRRCWNCDAVDHFSNSCPRKYGSLNEGSPTKLKSSERST